MEKGRVSGAVFLELRKVFDTCCTSCSSFTSSRVQKWQGKVWHYFIHFSLVEFNEQYVIIPRPLHQKSPWQYHRVTFLGRCYSITYHNAVCLSPQKFQFLLGVKMAARETEYNKFWGDKQRALRCVMVFSGVVNDTQNL